MTTSFVDATRVEMAADGTFSGRVPPGWEQGEGTFGGVVLGLLARAAQQALERRSGTQQRIVSLSAELMAPVFAGVVRGSTSQLASARDGGYVEGRLLGPDGASLARMTALLYMPMEDGRREIFPTAPVVQAGAWQKATPIPVGPPMAPAFALNYDYRSNAPVPFSGADAPRSSGWIRAREPAEPMDVPMLIGLLDAWWPATYVSQSEPDLVVTVSFAAQFPALPAALSASEPCFCRGHVVTQSNGYCTEFRELWQGQRLAATNQQVYKFLRRR